MGGVLSTIAIGVQVFLCMAPRERRIGKGERGIKNFVSKLTGRLNLLFSNQISNEFLWAFGKALRLGWPIQDAERKTEREISQEVSRAISQKQTVN